MNKRETEVSFYPSSENTLLLTWPERICQQQHQRIMALNALITKELALVVDETVISYNALIVYYAFEKITYLQLCQRISALLEQIAQVQISPAEQQTCIEIPVYYGEEVALDLNEVAKRCQLTREQVIKLHSQTTYHAYALGFTPGFCYLGTLAKALALPRKDTPRLAIPKGAVAIAEQQTAVYPTVSPGGWHIIGQTPLPMFTNDAEQFIPTISVGSQVTFKAINKQRFVELGGQLDLSMPSQKVSRR